MTRKKPARKARYVWCAVNERNKLIGVAGSKKELVANVIRNAPSGYIYEFFKAVEVLDDKR